MESKYYYDIYIIYRAKKRMIFTPLNILNAGFYNKIDYK